MENIEGILLNKFPYQDKHLIGHLLLRNGMKTSLIFYGGQGGGKNTKGSALQVGYMFKIMTGKIKSNFDIITAKEYSDKWCHKNISINPSAFYLLYFFCEFIEKFSLQISTAQDLNLEDESHSGLFRLLSNALFYLDKDVLDLKFEMDRSLTIFLIKALVETGLFPRTQRCCISGEEFSPNAEIYLISENGGFAHGQFLSNEEYRKNDKLLGAKLRQNMIEISSTKYGDEFKVSGSSKAMNRTILEYICFQQNLKVSDFKAVQYLL